LALVVHHRDRHNRANLLVTLCIRCHIRIHHSSGLKYWFSETLVRFVARVASERADATSTDLSKCRESRKFEEFV
jgi:hypothetical protein